MIITIASGKGGTGKTTVAVNLAAALARSASEQGHVRLLDCDVEEPNCHLFVKPRFSQEEPVEVMRPVWSPELCTGCGKCQQACNFNAIAVVQTRKPDTPPARKKKTKVLIFPELCHACGTCTYVCPEGALSEEPVVIGTVEADPDNGEFYFAHGMLKVGEPLAPAMVRAVKKHALTEGITIMDAAPGTACPVVEAVQGADVCLLVTEPTPFGLHDLKLAVSLALKMAVPTCVVVNRSDGQDTIIQQYTDEVGIPIVGRISFKRQYAEVYSRGDLLVDAFPGLMEELVGMYELAADVSKAEPPPVPDEEIMAQISRVERRGTPAQQGDYLECVVISGKGGTGKTIVTACVAALSEDKVMADADVDAPDLHLLLRPVVREVHDFVGGKKALIREDDCTGCGECAQMCHFDAIEPHIFDQAGQPESYRVNEFACEGCGLCGYVCPVRAIDVTEAVTGQRFVSDTRYGAMSHALLGVAEENSGKLVTRVRESAAELALQHGARVILADGPPGTGCPVIASISGVDVALIVSEPTVSGVHDLERVLALCRHFHVRALVCINKSDLNSEQADRIRLAAHGAEATVIAEIPFDPLVNEALNQGKILVEFGHGPAAEAMHRLWQELQEQMHTRNGESHEPA